MHPMEILVYNNQTQLLSIHTELLDLETPDFILITQKILQILDLSPPTDKAKAQSFKYIWKPHQDKTNFFSFLKVVSRWAMIHKFQNSSAAQKQSDYLSYLNNLSGYYRMMANKAEGEDLESIRKVIKSISDVAEEVSKQYFNGDIRIVFRTEMLDVEIQSLKEIFKFFAVQHLFLGRSPTFEMIREQCEVMDCGTFLAFCKQFSLFYEEKRQKLTQRTVLTQIFKKNSTLNTVMTFPQFLAAVESIALIYFDKENDLVGLRVWEYAEDQRKILFLDRIRVADGRMNRRRMRPLSQNSLKQAGHSRIDAEQSSLLGSIDRTGDRIRAMEVARSFIKRNNSQDKLGNRENSRIISVNPRRANRTRICITDKRQYSAARPKNKV